MPNPIDNLVDSGEPVDVIAGALLEHLVKSNPTAQGGGIFTSSTAASMVGESSGGAPSKRMLKVLEAFGWLINRDMLAASTQQGMVFVTDKGKDIGTAASLKAYLEQQQGSTEAATKAALKEFADIKQRTETEVADLKEKAASDIAKAIEDAKREASQILGDAKNEAGQILNLARKTAEGVSLKDVQKQFANASEVCLKRIQAWGALSCGAVAAFICILIGFMTWWTPPLQAVANATGTSGIAYPMAIYQAAIRITLLTAIGAVATFCFRVLRAQMHLREQNLHRERVANSVDAFLGAASPEQRDVILSRMVDAITVFGNSGLLSDNDESMSPAKLLLESIPRVASGKS